MDAVIGLGSNLGDRRALLARAVASCAELGELSGVSALYETAPVGPPQPDYLNAALRLRTELSPQMLLDRLLELEAGAGRARRERWAARTLDLDLLWAQGVALETPRLIVPHPRLCERAFALVPLLDVAPDATDPKTAIQYARIAARIDRMGVVQIASSEWWRSAEILRSFPH